MHRSRRALLGGVATATFLGLAACATTGGSVSFATVQAYVADATATFDKLVPLVLALNPAAATQLHAIQASADAAAAAFAALTGPASGAGAAQQVISLISDGLTVISAMPGLPAAYVAAIAAAQVLLVTVGSFFNVTPVTPASARLGQGALAASLWSRARATYAASPSSAPVQADARVRAFLAS